MSLALVDQLNFDKQMPIDGNCMQQISVTVPATGSGPYYPGGYFLINIARCGQQFVFDPMNSFLRFKVTNPGDQSCTPDHRADSFIEKLEVLHAGNVLEQINSYGVLSSMLLDCQVDPYLRRGALNATKGCDAAGGIKGSTLSASGTAGNSAFYSVTLLSGIVGSLCRNYIPVNELEGSIQIRVTLAASTSACKWTTAPTNTDQLVFSDIEFHANMIKLSEPILAMVKSNNYTIYTESYNNFRQSVASNVMSIEQLIPTRYSSLKTVFVVQRVSATSLNTAHTLNPNSRDTFQITDCCFRLGSEQIPPSRVRCEGYDYVEAFEALKVAFHCGGNALTSMGILNRTTYKTTASSALGGLFIIGQDFESSSGKSGSILSGISTLGSDLYFSANYSTGGIAAAAIFDFFLHYDMKLIIENRILTVNV